MLLTCQFQFVKQWITNMNHPLITIITPTLNSAQHIEACILSVAGQSYEHKEHLIIDNLSIDGTLEIAKKYSAIFPHIRVINEQDNGIYEAMNKGIDNCRGEWIYFLGSDDRLFDCNVLMDIVTTAEIEHTEVIYGNVQWGKDGFAYDGEFSFIKIIEKNICHQAIFCRREVFERVGKFNTRYMVLADWAFNMQWFGNNHIKRKYIDRLIAIYNTDGYSSKHTDHLFLEEKDEIIRKYFPEAFVTIFYTQFYKSLTEKENRIQQLQQLLAEQERKIQSHFLKSLTEKENSIRQLQQLLTEQERKMQSMQQISAVQLQKERAAKELQIAERDAIIAARDMQIMKIYSSSSWKLTKPIRKISKSVRKRSRKIRKTLLMASGRYQSINTDCNDANNYHQWIANFDTLDNSKLQQITADIDCMSFLPKISVIMPVYNPPVHILEETIKSVRNQLYPNWELCIADDCSADPEVRSLIEQYQNEDRRIISVFRQGNGHISAASNSAIELATGEYTALLDHDDLLHPLALYWNAKEINNHPDVGLIYSDEDKIDTEGKRSDPYFKSDFNYDLFLCQNMISHLGVYKTNVIRELGGFREGLEGSQDYDLALRVIERLHPSQIRHIPRVLYHWRILEKSTAASIEAKPYARNAAMRAVKEHLDRIEVNATVTVAKDAPVYNRVQYVLPNPLPSVEIIIPTKDQADLLKACIDSVLHKTTYQNYSITVIDNDSQKQETFNLFRQWQENPLVRIIHDPSPFNYSRLNNRAVEASSAEYICLLNNDIEVISPEWLTEMISHAAQPEVGAVGARLWYPNQTLQHGGVIIGLGGVAGHSHKHISHKNAGYFGRACLQQSFSAVTGACMVIQRQLYLDVGGLNQDQLTIAFNDIDFCLKLREKGLRNIWTPYAELYHHESRSRGYEDTRGKRDRFQKECSYMEKKWQHIIRYDPAYNPNLTLDSDDFAMAWPPRTMKQELNELHHPSLPAKKITA
jgi:glycosyltransferase involved in cell wall biosynthesis